MPTSPERLQDKRIAVLNRRADHLQRRVDASPKDLTFDRAEIAALRWAVAELTERTPA